MKTKANHPSTKDIYQTITDQIFARLEQGFIPWQNPWNAKGTACNYVTGKGYRGINALLLNSNAVEHPYYLSFKQATDLGGKIKKGAKAEMVTYWNWTYTHKDTGSRLSAESVKNIPANKISKTAFLKYYNVFNVADVEGVNFTFPEINQRSQPQKLEACELIIEAMPNAPKIQNCGDKAYYSPLSDYVNMPSINLFTSPEFYYSVFFHELTHSTGHPKRLARKEEGQVNRFGSELYSKEELVAELGASFLCGFSGISQQTLENSAAYIQNWLKVLKDDNKFIVEAASKAQQATDYILNTFGQPDNDQPASEA